MQMYEVSAILKHGYMKAQDDWEQARMIAYVIAQCNSTKNIRPEQIISFEWDKTKKREITNEQIEDMAKMAKALEQNLKAKFSRQQ